MKAPYAYVVVYSTSHAIRIEKLLEQRGIDCKLVPVPRQLSSDCGVCVRITSEHVQAAEETVLDAGIEIEGIHLV
jgi:hypothetical protein